MPIYDYQCRACRHRFELLVKPDEKVNCPKCGATGAERAFPLSVAVSTGRTRGRALTEARGKAGAMKKEKDHAHQEYMRNHLKDHS
jgi:putative FmdB family regulatory protein